MVISRSVIFRMRNVSDKSCRENQNIHVYTITFFQNRAVYEITWKNIAESDRPQMTIWQYALLATYQRLKTQAQNMYYSLFFDGNNGYTNATQCYIKRTLSFLFLFEVGRGELPCLYSTFLLG